jgi:hypothetical protein
MKPKTEVTQVWEKYLGGGVQMAARRGYRGRSSFEKQD